MKLTKLNDVSARAAETAAKGYSIGDGSGPCLYVAPTGGKLWRWSYEYNRQEKLISFGRYPAISLAAARRLHNAAGEMLVNGRDPMAERKRIETGKDGPNTPKKIIFGEVLALWLAHLGNTKDERYVTTVKNHLEKMSSRKLAVRPLKTSTRSGSSP
jgi:hypothetical protein